MKSRLFLLPLALVSATASAIVHDYEPYSNGNSVGTYGDFVYSNAFILDQATYAAAGNTAPFPSGQNVVGNLQGGTMTITRAADFDFWSFSFSIQGSNNTGDANSANLVNVEAYDDGAFVTSALIGLPSGAFWSFPIFFNSIDELRFVPQGVGNKVFLADNMRFENLQAIDAVPEPSSLAFLGLAGMAALRRRRKVA